MTLNTRWRIPHFGDEALGIECLRAIEHERRRIRLNMIAFALMPDHFHLIITPPPIRVGLVVHALKNASVHRNPAVAGLVEDPSDYTLSSCGLWVGKVQNPIVMAAAPHWLSRSLY